MKKIALFSLLLISAYPTLHQQQELLEGKPHFHWPFSGMLKEHLCEEGKDYAVIFSYGSLINEASAARTLSPESLKTRRTACAYGIQRLFNRNVPEDLIVPRYGPLKKPNETAALNVRWTGNPKDSVNGVLVDVFWDDLKALCEREVGYDLIPVVVTLWGGENYFVAYTFSAPDGAIRDGVPLTSSAIMPIPGYYRVVRAGAASYGPAYLKEYLEDTYLADGHTTLEKWEAEKKGP